MKAVVVFIAVLTLARSVLSQNWHRSEDGSLYYIVSENNYNWYEAWNDCARKNMSLIAIDTLEKHQQIDTLIRKIYPTCPSFWLAGHDNAVDKRYEWATTGATFGFTNWGPNQPDRLTSGSAVTEEHCILIWQNTWKWYDLPCNYEHLGFICEENQLLKAKYREWETLNRKTCELKGTFTIFSN